MLMLFVPYHGEVGLDPWEYLVSFVYVMVLYIHFARKKRMNMMLHPEYKYYMAGLLARFFGGLVFCLIYLYYYPGGDSLAYFYSGVAVKKMLFIDPVEYFRQVILGDNSTRALATYASLKILPYKYVFLDSRTFQAIRVSSILAVLTFNSYLISTILMASISFAGVWACFRTFVSYFPKLAKWFSIAFLFMPSAIFWGSGIMKDTLTFSAVCGWVYAVDEVFFKRRNVVSRGALILFCGLVMIQVKPYIFMVILPATLLWLFYFRVVRIRNIMVRFVLIPVISMAMVVLSVFVLKQMGDLLDKFALEGALYNIENIQGDMVNNTAYGDNKFDVGEFDGTWWGVLKKFPVATNAALFRPYLWESKSLVVALSGLENLFILILTIYVLLKAGVRFSLRCIASNPLLLMSMSFALLFAFVVGVSTPNFGALVRFKIPMLPFYMSSLFIILFLHNERKKARMKGVKFDLTKYRMGAGQIRRGTGQFANSVGRSAETSNHPNGLVYRT